MKFNIFATSAVVLFSSSPFASMVNAQGDRMKNAAMNNGDELCHGKTQAETEIDLYNSTVTESTLHLPGGKLVYENVGIVRDNPVNLVVTIYDGDYTTSKPDKNGKGSDANGVEGEGMFGNINLQTKANDFQSGEGNFEFCFHDKKTDELVTVDSFMWSVYDLDERSAEPKGIKEKFIIDTKQAKDYVLWPNTEESEVKLFCENFQLWPYTSASQVNQLPCNADERIVFHSSTKGVGSDNPKDKDDMSDLQKSRSVQFTFVNTSCWRFTYNHYCPPDEVGNKEECVWYGGGNFLFAGSAKQLIEEGECITDSPTQSPTDVPTKTPTKSPTISPTLSPTQSPTKTPTKSPTVTPTAAPTKVPTASPTASPSKTPTAAPTKNPTVSPTQAPTDVPTKAPTPGPTKNPTQSPTVSPTVAPTKEPTVSPTAPPTKLPTNAPTSEPTSHPTESMMPTDCTEPAKPKIVESICMTTNGEPMDLIPMPENAIVVSSQDGADNVGLTVTQAWKDEAGLAVRSGLDHCIVKGNLTLGSTEDIEGECIDGYTNLLVAVYLDDYFDPDDCEACNVDDLAELGGNYEFCAYVVEVPCEPISVECGVPTSAPSGSPTKAPTPSPTASPTASPSKSPTSSPTKAPTNAPTNVPTSSPTKSMMPTDCSEPAPPIVIDSVCMTTDGGSMDVIPLPENTIKVWSQNDNESLEFTVTQAWKDEAGMAVQTGLDECVVKGNLTLGSNEDFLGECISGSTSLTIVVYLDQYFDPEECEACNVDDLDQKGGDYEFCAYRVEIPCDIVPVECGEPTATPSALPSSKPSASHSQAPTKSPSDSPTLSPTKAPSASPTVSPTKAPTNAPTDSPSASPSGSFYPSSSPSSTPTSSMHPSSSPTDVPTKAPTPGPTKNPTQSPTVSPTVAPTNEPTASPTLPPTKSPTVSPTKAPTNAPTNSPSASPSGSFYPSSSPSNAPTASMYPSSSPTDVPTKAPTPGPTKNPTQSPTVSPTLTPTKNPTQSPTLTPTKSPTLSPTTPPTKSPTVSPTLSPTVKVTRPPIDTNGGDDDDDDFIFEPACPEDVELVAHHGKTDINLDRVVKIVSQDTSTVRVALNQGWDQLGDEDIPIDSIYYSFRPDTFDEKCYEETSVMEGTVFDTITIQCHVTKPFALLEICLVDDLKNELLTIEDDGTVPQCCHPTDTPEKPTVCYKIKINCKTECVEDDDDKVDVRRGLRGSR